MGLWRTSLTTEHKNALDNVVVSIFAYVENVFIIKGIYDHIGQEYKKQGIASPYLNFRDALFHYRKMYQAVNTGDNNDVLQQAACIDEHLNRGIRDFAIHLCINCYIPIIHNMMTGNFQSVTDVIFQRLRRIYHELKNIVADIRLGGSLLQRFGQKNVDWMERIIAAIQDFNNLLEKYPSLRTIYKNS